MSINELMLDGDADFNARLDNESKLRLNFLKVRDWRELVSPGELEEYKKLDKFKKALYEKASKDRSVSDDKLREYAKAIEKAEKEQKKIIYKYDFKRFVDEMFEPVDGEELLQDKAETPDFHLELYNAFMQSKRVCGVCPRGHGKEIANSTPVLTNVGWKTHGELKVGDYVFSPSGKQVQVIYESEENVDDYIVETMDGEKIRCHANHEWTVFDRNPRKFITVETKNMLDYIRVDGGCRYSLPLREPLQYVEKALPLDSYYIGLWLGDGYSSSNSIVCDKQDLCSIKSIPYKITHQFSHNITGVITTGFGFQGITKELKKLNLYNNKHIPDEYLSGSIEQRLELLAGLIDSDGSVCQKRGRIRFVNSNKTLAYDVEKLVISLGMRPYITKQKPHSNGKGINGKKIIYTVNFDPIMEIPMRIPRKHINRFPLRKRLGIKSVKYEPNGEKGKCIEVASSDGLYLVGNRLIPTHNSSAARIYILHQLLNGNFRYGVLIGSAEEMAAQNLRWIRDQLTDNPRIVDLYGDLRNKSKWAETEFITSTKIKLVAKGAGQKLRGANEKGRPDLIYIDDLEDDEAVNSRESRGKLARWFKEAILPMKSKNGRFIITGTILHIDSLLRNIAKNMIRDHIKWDVLWYQAINKDKDGKEYALWEDVKPLHELVKLRDIDPQTFSQEYQNNPTSGGMAVFKPEWFRFYKRDDIIIDNTNNCVFVHGNRVNLMLATDLAISEKEGADYNVLAVSGMDKDGNLFFLEVLRFRSEDVYETILLIFSLLRKWHCDYVTMEIVAFQKAIQKQIERSMDEEDFYFHIEEMKRFGTTKMARIKGLQSPIKNGKVFFLDEHSEYIDDEFMRMTATKLPPHDDFMDCVVDSWEKQVEARVDKTKEIETVNSIEWLQKHGYLSDPFKRGNIRRNNRRGVR